MLDIETMGNESYSSIISIGAVEFDIKTGDTGNEFHTYISLHSCIDAGLIITPQTVLWWLEQDIESINDLISGQKTAMPLTDALQSFSDFINNNDYQVWANSPRFDCGILQNAYTRVGIPIPWNFRNERCVRTLASFNPEKVVKYHPIGVIHNALADCRNQIGYCSMIWNDIFNNLDNKFDSNW